MYYKYFKFNDLLWFVITTAIINKRFTGVQLTGKNIQLVLKRDVIQNSESCKLMRTIVPRDNAVVFSVTLNCLDLLKSFVSRNNGNLSASGKIL